MSGEPSSAVNIDHDEHGYAALTDDELRVWLRDLIDHLGRRDITAREMFIITLFVVHANESHEQIAERCGDTVAAVRAAAVRGMRLGLFDLEQFRQAQP